MKMNNTTFLKFLITLCVTTFMASSVFAAGKQGTSVWDGSKEQHKKAVWVSGAKKELGTESIKFTFSGDKWEGAGLPVWANLKGKTHLRITLEGLDNKPNIGSIMFKLTTGMDAQSKKEQNAVKLRNYQLKDSKFGNAQVLDIPMRDCNPKGDKIVFQVLVSTTQEAEISLKSIEAIDANQLGEAAWTSTQNLWVSGAEKEVANNVATLTFPGGKWAGAGLSMWANIANKSTMRLVVTNATKRDLSKITVRLKTGDDASSMKEQKVVNLRPYAITTLESGEQVIDIPLAKCNESGGAVVQQVLISSSAEATISLKEILFIGKKKVK